jgi:molybdopterin molybdotransferase
VIGMQILPEVLAHIQCSESQPLPHIPAHLTTNVASLAGREDFMPVRLIRDTDSERWLAEPVLGRSNLIFTLVRADGHIRIPADTTGLEADSPVNVIPFRR